MATREAAPLPMRPAAGGAMDAATACDWLGQMLRIRRFEEAAAEQYSAGNIRGFLHLYVGEEAVALGAIHELGPEDAIVST